MVRTGMYATGVRRVRTNARDVRVAGRAPRWIIPSVKAALVVADSLIAAGSFISAFYIREGEAILRRTGESGFTFTGRFAPYAALLLFVVVIRLLTLSYYDLYRLRGEFSFVEDGIRVFKAIAIGSLLIVSAAFLYRGGFQFRAFSYARGVFVLDFLIAFMATSVLRVFVRSVQSSVRRRGINLIPTLVVGRGSEAAFCIKEMRERPSLGYLVIGVVENSSIAVTGPEDYEGVPVVSRPQRITRSN